MITFSYPGYSEVPISSVSLGSPERGDDRTDLEEVFIHPTEAGSFKSNVQFACIGEFERSISFTSLCKQEKNDFLDFVRAAMGHYIKYTDYDDVVWITQITDEVINVSNSSFGWNVDLSLLAWEAA